MSLTAFMMWFFVAICVLAALTYVIQYGVLVLVIIFKIVWILASTVVGLVFWAVWLVFRPRQALAAARKGMDQVEAQREARK